MQARRSLGLPTPTGLGALGEPLHGGLAEVQAGKTEPFGALRSAMEQGVTRYSRVLRGYRLERVNFSAATMPDEIPRANRLALEVGVTHHRTP